MWVAAPGFAHPRSRSIPFWDRIARAEPALDVQGPRCGGAQLRAAILESDMTAQQPGAVPFFPEPQGLFDPKREHDACGVGFIADLKGGKSHQLVEDALAILCNVEHRGAVGADPIAGDGAGILIQIPHELLAEECAKLKLKLPKPGHYAVGHIFMPQDERLRAHCERVWARIVREEGLEL